MLSTPRNDVNYVVTEYGIAQLKGKTLKERAKALIRIAHPSFRPYLMEEYQKRFSETPFTDEEMKSFKDAIAEIIQTKREEFHSTIEQKIDKLISKK